MKADKGRKFEKGGALKETDAETNPGLAKLPTEVRNKMGYMKKGGMTNSGKTTKKTKRFAEGGITINQQPAAQSQLAGLAGYGSNENSLYPTRSGEAGDAGSQTTQTFNMQPQANASPMEATTMKRGGKVSSASRRGDGCAIRGKTRA
jgi:hypothetical protein